jgi:RNA polymerase sigma-70 factor (ECF subfamily)
VLGNGLGVQAGSGAQIGGTAAGAGNLISGSASYAILADKLVSNMASPSSMADRREKLARVRDAIDGMDEIDREILVLRHFEEMSNKDIADLLGIGQPAASNRYLRALNRLRTILIDESGAI